MTRLLDIILLRNYGVFEQYV